MIKNNGTIDVSGQTRSVYDFIIWVYQQYYLKRAVPAPT